MADLAIKGHDAAWMGNGKQQLKTTEISASQAKEITTTLGINGSKDNDYTVEVPFKKADGTDGKVFVTPDELATLKQLGKATQNATDTQEFAEPIQVYQKGAVIGTIDPKMIPSK